MKKITLVLVATLGIGVAVLVHAQTTGITAPADFKATRDALAIAVPGEKVMCPRGYEVTVPAGVWVLCASATKGGESARRAEPKIYRSLDDAKLALAGFLF